MKSSGSARARARKVGRESFGAWEEALNWATKWAGSSPTRGGGGNERKKSGSLLIRNRPKYIAGPGLFHFFFKEKQHLYFTGANP